MRPYSAQIAPHPIRARHGRRARRLTCGEEFADGFDYIVREEIGEGDVADHLATVEPWIETT